MGSDPSGHSTLTDIMTAVGVVGILHSIAIPTLNHYQVEINSLLAPDAGVIGISGSSSYVTELLGQMVPGIPAVLGKHSFATLAVEVVFSIASAQLAVFVAPGAGISSSSGESAYAYSGLVWNMWNVDEYSGNFYTASGSGGGYGGSAFSGDALQGGPTGISFGRTFGDPSASGSLSWTSYQMVYKQDFSNMASSVPLAATWGAGTSFIFSGANPAALTSSFLGASFWPYAKWKTPATLKQRQITQRNGGRL